MSHRFEGRNLEEALQTASQSLGVERWKLTHHTILEKRGFLGGVKRVVVEVEVNESAAPPASAAAPVQAAEAPMAAVAPPDEAPRAARPDRMDRAPRSSSRRGQSPAPAQRDEPRRSRGRGGRGGGERGGRGRDTASDLRPGDFEQFMIDVPEQGTQSADAKLVADWCESLIDRARLDLAVRTEENETQLLVRLYGRDSRRLLDHHAELLDAIQVLANKALVGRKVEKEIELDAEQYKDRRNEELRQRAIEVADRVRREGVEELLPAMTPIERRIIHIALRDDADVTTESRGEGFYKRVAIVRRSDTSATPES